MEPGDAKPLTKEGPETPRALSQRTEPPALTSFVPPSPRQPRQVGPGSSNDTQGHSAWGGGGLEALGLWRGGCRPCAGR